MKFMKKMGLGIGVIMMSGMLMACSLNGSENKNSNSSSQTEELDTYSYKRTEDDGDCGGTYDMIYNLTILNAKEAKLEIQTVYSDKNFSTSCYIGSYDKQSDEIIFTYEGKTDGCDDSAIVYRFVLDNGKITEVYYGSEDYSEYAGTYNGKDDEYGSMTLSINKYGHATLTTEKGEYEGSIMIYDERVDFMAGKTDVVNDEDYESLDWYVDFDGDTFSFEKYSYSNYKEYAGTYNAFGDLGQIQFVCDDEGNATCSIEYNGVQLDMSGSFYVDYELKQISSIYVSNEDGYVLSLEFQDMGGELNYFGSISLPLSAG